MFQPSTDEDALKGVKPGGLNMATSSDSNLEYVPAEYFRGVVRLNKMIQTVSASNSVRYVQPDVLASGQTQQDDPNSVGIQLSTICPARCSCKWSNSNLHDSGPFTVINHHQYNSHQQLHRHHHHQA